MKATTVSSFLIKLKYQLLSQTWLYSFAFHILKEIFYVRQFEQSILTKLTTCSMVSMVWLALWLPTIISNIAIFFCISYSSRNFYLTQFKQSILTKLTTCSVVSIRYVTYSSTFCRTVCIISCIHLYWKSSAHFTVITISIISSSTFWK